jgi:hypothetical protein
VDLHALLKVAGPGDFEAAQKEVERRLRAWLRHRPGADHGDGVAVVAARSAVVAGR